MTKFEHTKKMRIESARLIKLYCQKQYPNCRECDYCDEISNRICKCKVNKPISWEVV